MQSTWHVDKVTMTERGTVAEMSRVEWWKTNPEYTALFEDEDYEGDMPNEFIDAHPRESDAEMLVMGTGTMTIELADDQLLDPGDDLVLTIATA